jgi:hypothetical protein
MPVPPTDFAALLGISLVLCAVCLCLLSPGGKAGAWVKGMTAGLFLMLWLPVGSAQLPVVAYIRGVSSDLSITLVLLAGLGLYQRLFGLQGPRQEERTALFAVVAAAALILYPTALLESSNLWEYLIDPWLVFAAVIHGVQAGILKWRRRFLRVS